MARTKKNKPGSARRLAEKEVKAAGAEPAELSPEPIRETRDESPDEAEVLVADEEEPEEKDDFEVELEKLVFGDSVGFREGLRHFAGSEGTAQNALVVQEDEDEQGGLEGLADSDVCKVLEKLKRVEG